MKGGDEWAIRECTWNKINNQKLGQSIRLQAYCDSDYLPLAKLLYPKGETHKDIWIQGQQVFLSVCVHRRKNANTVI